jgi:hypothetical protein
MDAGRPVPKLSAGEKCWAREAGELYPSTIRKRQVRALSGREKEGRSGGRGERRKGGAVEAIDECASRKYFRLQPSLIPLFNIPLPLFPPPHPSYQYANGQWKYFVHYLGWNVRWDKWVGEFDLLLDNDETRRVVQMVKAVKSKNRSSGAKRQKVQGGDGMPEGSAVNKLEQMDEEREAERRRKKVRGGEKRNEGQEE